MRISTMLFPYHLALQAGEYSADTLLATLRVAGMSGLELAWEAVQDNPALTKVILQAAAAEQLQFPCLDVCASLATGDEEKNLRVLANCRQAFAFCRDEIACPIALLYGSAPAEGMSNAVARQHYGEMLGRCAELANEFGITVCIEDFGVTPRFTASSRHCLEVIHISNHPDVRFNFDNGNFLLADERPLEALEAVKELLCHVHIKDFCRRIPSAQNHSLCTPSGVLYRTCGLGDGAGEVVPCLKRLQELGYDGWLSSESGTTPASGAQAVRFIAQYWLS